MTSEFDKLAQQIIDTRYFEGKPTKEEIFQFCGYAVSSVFQKRYLAVHPTALVFGPSYFTSAGKAKIERNEEIQPKVPAIFLPIDFMCFEHVAKKLLEEIQSLSKNTTIKTELTPVLTEQILIDGIVRVVHGRIQSRFECGVTNFRYMCRSDELLSNNDFEIFGPFHPTKDLAEADLHQFLAEHVCRFDVKRMVKEMIDLRVFGLLDEKELWKLFLEVADGKTDRISVKDGFLQVSYGYKTPHHVCYDIYHQVKALYTYKVRTIDEFVRLWHKVDPLFTGGYRICFPFDFETYSIRIRQQATDTTYASDLIIPLEEIDHLYEVFINQGPMEGGEICAMLKSNNIKHTWDIKYEC